jgi:hypothetical protein
MKRQTARRSTWHALAGGRGARHAPAVRCVVLVAIVLAVAGLYRAHSARAETARAPDRPDFSGVWLPNSRESGRWPEQRPFTAAMEKLRAQWAKDTAPIDFTRDDDHTSCLPYTLPFLTTTITQYPFEIVSTSHRIYVFTEVYGQVRRIDLDAPPVSPEQLPTRVGSSRGHWEGAQLVVETTHILPENEGSRFPSSPALRVVERFSLAASAELGKQLVDEITILDPPVYREPFTIRMVYKPAGRDVVVDEYLCNQDIWDQHLDRSTSKIPWR